MHEYSQSADALDWNTTPYFYASADATCLIIMVMWDYVKASGDLGYLKRNWEAINKAYAFIRAHEAKNGVYSNSEGTGWVESWPPTMPYQEVYLAALDQQSCTAMSALASLMGNSSTSDSAHKKAEAIRKVLESYFF